MKLASFQAQGKDRFGFVAEGGLIDLSGRLSGRCADLAELLAKDLVADAARLVLSVALLTLALTASPGTGPVLGLAALAGWRSALLRLSA